MGIILIFFYSSKTISWANYLLIFNWSFLFLKGSNPSLRFCYFLTYSDSTIGSQKSMFIVPKFVLKTSIPDNTLDRVSLTFYYPLNSPGKLSPSRVLV